MKRYSLRTVTMVSSVMVTTGYTVSAFVPKLPILYVFYGAMSGLFILNMHNSFIHFTTHTTDLIYLRRLTQDKSICSHAYFCVILQDSTKVRKNQS